MAQSHITRYDLMPIPPLESQTTWFDAGVVRIGVEAEPHVKQADA